MIHPGRSGYVGYPDTPLPNKVKKMKTLKALVSAGNWSYIINDKGNGFSVTLAEYGSCTPENVLQEWIDKLPKKRWNEIYKQCDEIKEKII